MSMDLQCDVCVTRVISRVLVVAWREADASVPAGRQYAVPVSRVEWDGARPGTLREGDRLRLTVSASNPGCVESARLIVGRPEPMVAPAFLVEPD